MIFADTKVQVISFLKAGHRTAFLLSLSREGIRDVDWFESDSDYSIAEESPVILIQLYEDRAQKEAVAISPFNPNNAELIDVFLDAVPPTSKKTCLLYTSPSPRD